MVGGEMEIQLGSDMVFGGVLDEVLTILFFCGENRGLLKLVKDKDGWSGFSFFVNFNLHWWIREDEDSRISKKWNTFFLELSFCFLFRIQLLRDGFIERDRF